MDFDQIKNLIPQDGEKYIIVENGKPVLVLMRYEDYKKSLPKQKEIGFKNSNPLTSRQGRKELTLEDLPF